jgi:GNAT superfamily N-acetyltransferase
MVESHGHERRVAGIYVDPARHRAGIGAALLDRVIDDARADGVGSVVLDTQDDVPWNRPWYERHGFVVVPEPEWTDHMRAVTTEQTAEGLDWATRVHMRRELTAT